MEIWGRQAGRTGWHLSAATAGVEKLRRQGGIADWHLPQTSGEYWCRNGTQVGWNHVDFSFNALPSVVAHGWTLRGLRSVQEDAHDWVSSYVQDLNHALTHLRFDNTTAPAIRVNATSGGRSVLAALSNLAIDLTPFRTVRVVFSHGGSQGLEVAGQRITGATWLIREPAAPSWPIHGNWPDAGFGSSGQAIAFPHDLTSRLNVDETRDISSLTGLHRVGMLANRQRQNSGNDPHWSTFPVTQISHLEFFP